MATAPPVYQADDKSILLPFYKRFIIEPALPFIPARIHPNTITHLGHLVCLAGAALLLLARVNRGWPFLVAAVLLTLYVFCDNVDGGHARRTKQTSATGEFLDHGLDLFNTAYIGYMSSLALGADETIWVLMGFLIVAAAAAVYWEQAESGVFRLGLMSQLESSVVLTVALVVDAFAGTETFARPIAFGISLRLIIVVWTLASIASGYLRSMFRVGRQGVRRLAPVLSQIAVNAALLATYFTHTLGALPVVIVGSLANAAFGLRMLSHRLCHEKPKVDWICLIGGAALCASIVTRLNPATGLVLTVIGSAVFTLDGAVATRTGLRVLGDASSPSP